MAQAPSRKGVWLFCLMQVLPDWFPLCVWVSGSTPCFSIIHIILKHIVSHIILEALPCWYSILVWIIFSGSAILNTWYTRSWYPLNHTHSIRFIIFRIKTRLGYYTIIIPIFRHPFSNAQSETPEEAERTQIQPTLEHDLSSGCETPRLVDDD